MRLYLVNVQTHQVHFFIYWGPEKTNKADYFTKHHPPSHHIAISHEYLHKDNPSLIFVPLRGCVNHVMGITSPDMSHEPVGPKYNHQEPGGSTSDFLTLVTREAYPKSNCQEPSGSTSDCITLVLNKIFYVLTQNKITTPINNNMHKTDTTQKYNRLHRKYVDIAKNTWTSEHNADLLINSNTTSITLLMWFNYHYY